MAAPSNADLGALLVAAGVIEESPTSGAEYDVLTRAIAFAVAKLKAETGWNPFEGAAGTRYFTADGYNTLFLDQGLLSLTSVTIDGTTYAVNDDFYLYPANASTDGIPYRELLFVSNISSLMNGVVIVGTWGRMATYDSSATEAILAGAAIMAGATLAGVDVPLSAVVEIVQGPVKEKYSDSSMFGTFETWSRTWATFVNNNLRVHV